MSRPDGGRALTALALALSALLVVAGALALYLVITSSAPETRPQAAPEASLERKSFHEYEWDELAEVARIVAGEDSVEDAVSVAAEWGIEIGDVRPLPLADGRQATLTVVGIAHDERSDGSGRAGLTLMASPITARPMNGDNAVEGGWEGSDLRVWLLDEAPSLLPDALAQSLVPVRKATNNVGVTDDSASVTVTSETLWPFSVREVCGDVSVFVDEYGDEIRGRTDYIDYATYDDLLNLEGEQYAYFAESGVTCSSDPVGTLSLSYGGAATGWWYRTPYPYAFIGEEGSYFFQVMEGGYPVTLGYAGQASGVTVGLCL
ncbi:MAG: DUF6273 domain-containing protein [Atopobiaceae bacterium]|nr:DUF6273 domain-containing protein [Atopobiaceae bacterium]